ncbi:hypothetical protein PV783_13880 [Chitinophaga sp. CC14]|uniref:MauE/DoxX family redox-associated membrane protein n=1 Tax=Chitinophaga sp. CC14 TaxID=3029199 RepID=UPI003B7789A7
MKKAAIADMTVTILSMLFIILFVYAAGSKLTEFDQFRAQIGQSPLLTSWGGVVIWLIPLLEFGICLLLAIARWRLVGLYAFFTLMVMFSAYIVAINWFSSYVPCSCGGVLSEMNWNQHLVFNLAFVVVSALAIMLQKEEQQPNKKSITQFT